MSQHDLNDEDHWGLDGELNVIFEKINDTRVNLVLNGKVIGQMMIFQDHGVSIHFDHLVKFQTGIFYTMAGKPKESVGDYVDLIFKDAQELIYSDYFGKD